jgi:ribose transport system substrate-binding protein
MKKLLVVLLALVSVVALSSCGDQASMKIGFAASTFTNPFFTDIEDGILEVLEDTDYELVALGADNDSAKQAGQIEDLIAQGVDLILLNPVDSTTVGTKITEANEAGIPVITVDRSADEGEVVAHVASDNVLGGEMAAEFLETVCTDSSLPVLQLTGQAGASAATDRQAGFESVWGVDNIDQTSTANWSRTEGQTVTEAFLTAQGNPAAVCVFAANDEMALGAVQAIIANSVTDIAQSYVVGFDAIDDATASVEAGEMAATIAQQPVEIGRVAAQAALDYLAGEDVESSIPVALAVITKED